MRIAEHLPPVQDRMTLTLQWSASWGASKLSDPPEPTYSIKHPIAPKYPYKKQKQHKFAHKNKMSVAHSHPAISSFADLPHFTKLKFMPYASTKVASNNIEQ